MDSIKSYICNAARDGKLDSLKVLLYMKSKAEVAELISACKDCATPLVVACQYGHLKVVQYLIQKCHADVEEVGMVTLDNKRIEGVPPLWCAAAIGDLSIVETLIKHKASVNSITHTKSTPLRAACYGGHFEMVKYLIKNGADTDIVNCQGQTCLMVACYKGRYEICNYLVKCGAKMDIRDAYGNSALKICVMLGDVEMAKTLIELGANVEDAGCYKELSKLIYPYTEDTTALVMACNDGHLEIVKYLIQKCHADIEEVGMVKNVSGKFIGTSVAGHLKIVKILIKHNLFIDSYTQRISTPLYVACNNGHFEVVKYLIDNGADINFFNSYTTTCLVVALYKGHNKIVKHLMECGAKVDTVDANGYSALSICVKMGSLEKTKYLIKHGADIEVADRYGQTCLMIACSNKYHEITKYLLKCGANVNRKTLEGSTALHKCAESNNLVMVKMLFEKGAKLYINSSRTTPLLTAALNGHELIVNFFFNNYEMTKEDKIDAYELLGAANVDKTKDLIKAFTFWGKAMTLRYENTKFPIEKVLTNSTLASYLDTTEVYTFNQLNALNIANSDEMRKQSLLVRERIVGVSHHDTIHYIRDMGASSEENTRIQLWMYALEVQQQGQETLSPKTYTIFKILTELFSSMIQEIDVIIPKRALVLFHGLLCVFQRTLKEIERAFKLPKQEDLRHSGSFSDIINIAVHHVGLIFKLLPHLNQSDQIELKKAVYKFVHLNPTIKNGFTPLHLACVDIPAYKTNYASFSYPSLEIIDLLLEVGACPNTMDDNRNTPFHLAAMNTPCPVDILDLLLNRGAHLDNRNLYNITPLQLTNNTPIDIYPLRHLNLQCLSAQTINTFKIPYKGIVPKIIHEFLYAHCTH